MVTYFKWTMGKITRNWSICFEKFVLSLYLCYVIYKNFHFLSRNIRILTEHIHFDCLVGSKIISKFIHISFNFLKYDLIFILLILKILNS